MSEKILTEKDCIEELVRICRSICYHKHDEISLIDCRKALASTLEALNELQDEKARKAAERKLNKRKYLINSKF